MKTIFLTLTCFCSFFVIGKADSTTTSLILKGTEIEAALSHFGDYQSLEVLTLKDSSSDSLNISFESLTNLRELHLKNIPFLDIRTLVRQLNKLPQLKVLEIDNSSLVYLPYGIGKLPQLEVLKLTNNNISYLPADLCELEELKVLDVSNNTLQGLPDELKRLRSLKVIDASRNHDFLSAKNCEKLNELYRFESLILRGMKGIHPALNTLVKLKSLDISQGDYSSIPNLKSLRIEILRVGSSALKDNRHFEQLPLTSITSLNFESNSGFEQLPPSFASCKKINSFKVSYANIESGDVIQSMRRLKVLRINSSVLKNMDGLVLSLEQQKQIEKLHITNSFVAEIPDRISNLKKLDELQVRNCKLTNFPITITEQKSLITLDLSMNSIDKSDLSYIADERPDLKFVYDRELQKKEAPFEKTPLISEKIKNNPVENFQVKPSQAQVITAKSGNTIEIPENAFLDAKGNVVTEEVAITYKEYSDPLDILADGIDMTVMTEDSTAMLESFGMFEFAAKTKSGKELFPNPAQRIEVKYEVEERPEEARLYYYNDSTQQWIDRDDEVTALTQETTQAMSQEREMNRVTSNTLGLIQSLEPNIEKDDYTIRFSRKMGRGNLYQIKFGVNQIKPKELNENDYHFPVYKDEKKGLHTYSWVCEESKRNQDLRILLRTAGKRRYRKNFGNNSIKYYNKMNCESMKITPCDTTDNFIMTLVKDGKKYTLHVFPKSGSSINSMQKNALQFHSKYTSALDKRDEKWKIIQSIYDKRAIEIDSILNLEKEDFLVALTNYQSNSNISNVDDIRRTEMVFPVMSFGLSNLDQIIIIDQRQIKKLIANFTDLNGKRYDVKQVTLVPEGINTVYNFKPNNIRYRINRDYYLLATLEDGRSGYLTTDEFRGMLRSRKTKKQAVLHIFKKKKVSKEELSNLLTSR